MKRGDEETIPIGKQSSKKSISIYYSNNQTHTSFSAKGQQEFLSRHHGVVTLASHSQMRL